MSMGALTATGVVLRKDFLLEWRNRARFVANASFALLILLLFSFAMGPDSKLLARTAPGFLWLAIFMASILRLGESLRIEIENNALEGLRLAPLEARAFFWGKALANTALLAGIALVLVPATAAVYDIKLAMGPLSLAIVLFWGAAAISAPGTLFATMAVQARAGDLLLPLLIFPILVPALLSAVKATTLCMQGDPMNQFGSWMALLGAFTVIYWLLCSVLFTKVLES